MLPTQRPSLEAVTRPTMRFVAVKSAEQQAVLMLHKVRDLLVRQRTMLINCVARTLGGVRHHRRSRPGRGYGGISSVQTVDLCAAFGVGESTVHAKARVIEKALRIGVFDPKWTLPSLVGRNPLVWMAEVDGLLVDLRAMPRDVQEVAFAKGIIPYIPADTPDQS